MAKGIHKLIIWLTIDWLLFCLVYSLSNKGANIHAEDTFVVFSPLIPLFFLIFFKNNKIWALINRQLEAHTDAIDGIPLSRVNFWIALVAGLALFVELMIIRIHSSYFQLFAYFKNVSLLSCFLGLGIGYARGFKKPLATPFVLPLLSLQIIFMYFLRFNVIADLLQNPISEQLAFGLTQIEGAYSILMVYLFLVFIFVFNALCFVSLGQLASRLMMRREKLVAYSWNLIGSLAGILLFSLISFMWAPPSVWILLAAIPLVAIFRKNVLFFYTSLLALTSALMILEIPHVTNEFDIYSPYQILSLKHSGKDPLEIKTSNTYYQRILNLEKKNIRNNEKLQNWAEYYALPYYFKPKPEQVLIVGSGTGNDVAAAVRHGAGQIDAVEIDPTILDLGKKLHPEAPYAAPNVNAVVNDARSFIQQTDNRYDLIVYGLLDSHTLLSGRSGGIRLDSYVYTVEGFRAAREKLYQDGMISLTFSNLSQKLGQKIFLMLKDAFDGEKPLVYLTGYDGGYTFLAGKGIEHNVLDKTVNHKDVTGLFQYRKWKVDLSTDDWPFFYMPFRTYPLSYIILLVGLLAISGALVRELVPKTGSGFSAPCFFLGAGFMLIETKAITELALVYGSTWIVISVVIAFILIMAFLANLFVMKKETPSPWLTYGFLFISLMAGLGLTYVSLRDFTSMQSRFLVPLVLTLPIFFSGFAFSTELKKSSSVATALSSNLLGAMVGGMLEYNAMLFGFRSLYYFAILMYAAAFLGSQKAKRANFRQ